MTTFEKFDRLPRPILRWCAILAFLWVAGIADIAAVPMDNTIRSAVLAFIATLYGLRGWEKVKSGG